MSAQKQNDRAVITLHVTSGPDAGRVLTFFEPATCVVGRSRKAHVRLSESPLCSRFHCRLEINPPHIVIVDLESTNGTRVNGKRIETKSLTDGDVVKMGDAELEVRITVPEPTPVLEETLIVSPSMAARAAPRVSTGETEFPEIPGYQIERLLGQGAMGSVFLAERRSTEEKVAIKVMQPMVEVDPRGLDRFVRECSIVMRLQHKRIVQCLDFGVGPDGPPYLVMEYVDALNVQEFLSTMTQAERTRVATGLVVRLLDGLQYAHERQIVHRDIKPGNVLVSRSGNRLQLKLTDFGLAKNYVDAGFSDCSLSNELCGTVAYMSPEQLMNCRYAKPACDLYSAGICLYNLISGRLPFESEYIARQISMILSQPPIEISDHVSGLPDALCRVIQQAISYDPSDRFASAEQMREALLPFSKRPES